MDQLIVGRPVAGAAPAAVRRAGRRRVVGYVVPAGALLVGAVLVAAALLGGAAAPEALSDPGPLTRWGLLALRLACDLSAIGTIGVLLVAVLLLASTSGAMRADGARLLRAATWWSAVWCATAVLAALLTLSTVAGIPLASVVASGLLPLALDLEPTRALLATAWLALLVGAGSRGSPTPARGALLLLGAGWALVLPVLTGHAGHGGSGALAATGGAVHVGAAAVWVGGLGALVVHLRGTAATLNAVLRRYSAVALGCFALVAVSGALTGVGTVDRVDQLWSTPYGQLLLAKVVALVGLGAMGHRHRVRTIAAAAQGRPRAFVALATGELVVMACGMALAVALSHTAPPVGSSGHAAGPGAADVVTAASGR
ncbi:copper resistance D family protein [Cellulomonas aerilata]|uniref:Copper resistance protein D domain-containing protein n=1 Tax=Cellulomonas aerilata TaxID=515326 RepID=A0A512DGX2_9CELL|nr:CopD family protein [Cellulomonas aerilata]GEO35676.1 hypothetical protein CAE01nite_34010 [Cellulomonas aerilata]